MTTAYATRLSMPAALIAGALLSLTSAARAQASDPKAVVAPDTTPMAAPAGPAAPPEKAAAVRHDDGRRTMRRLPANVGRGLIGVWHGDNLVPLLLGATATGAASYLDDPVRDTVTTQFDWGDSFETAGGPVYSTLFVAGMFTAGRFAHGPRFRAMTYDMLDAAVVNFTYSEILKLAVGRERPNGQDNKSFPSGHTSNAFAMAAVAERHYGWKVGVPAYLLAGLMGASRVNEDKHWISDVVAGATVGFIAGRTVVRVNDRSLEGGAPAGMTLSVSPILARHARGFEVIVMF